MTRTLDSSLWEFAHESPWGLMARQKEPTKVVVPNNIRQSARVEVLASVRYNGGIHVSIGGREEHIRGFRIPEPVAPEGFFLRSLGCGAQLNVCPPTLTMVLVRKDPETKKQPKAKQ